MYNLFDCVGVNVSNVNRAFDNVLSWMDDINMASEADDMVDELQSVYAKDNPFDCTQGNRDYDPTNKMIRLLYEHATATIKRKFPDAIIVCVVDGYNSSFKIDDDTYEKGRAERMAE